MKYHPFAYWLLAIVAGIWVSFEYFPKEEYIIYFIAFALLLLLFIRLAKLKNGFIFFSGFLIVMGLGSLRFHQENPDFNSEFDLSKQKSLYYIEVQDILKPSEKYNKYDVKIIASDYPNDTALINQDLLLYLKKQEIPIHAHDQFWIYGKIDEIPAPKNPHAFDYRAYMKNKKIYLQIFSDSLAGLEHPNNNLLAHRLSVFKQNIKNELNTKGFSQTSKIFISSLALGDRSDVDKDFQEKLSSAGVMHLFAISGLHVGIIFGFIMILLYPLLYIRHGKVMRWAVALVLIWIFAWFVGFSPSVTRAAFMISIYYFTLTIQRNPNIYHTLALSALVLLFIQPNQLFEVGFQMSYSAVFFIAWLYQPVRQLFPHYRKPYKNYLFNLICLTTVAQIGVLPISVYYFNKFSGLFLLGNLVVLPFASIMVALSFVVVLTLALNVFPDFLVDLINYAFEKVYQYIDFLTSYESFIFRDITWNWLQVLLLISLIILVRPLFLQFKWRKLIPVFMILLAFQATRVYDDYTFNNKQELIVFQQYKGSLIGIREGKKLDIFWQVEDSTNVRNYIINPYMTHEKIKHLDIHDLMSSHKGDNYIKFKNLIKLNEQVYYISDNQFKEFPAVDAIILTQAPYYLPDSIPSKIKRIIADGSNYPSQIQYLKEKSDSLYYTNESGAYLEAIQ
ncbi:ComEC family competence protein [Weeksellaceae bacterium KMM 9724]|uniref:ComEC/Rec2 family competence protein n=1 Tax=Profundicola chukchiensis TaxID=2961959 RepID=UPI0024374F90|nr:ComEC/Rec2 family competence protein [Profundicola chukchiensis]MDG4950243.1 ComEC family competence protein [Profundicola chukchiensis]